MSEVIQCKGCGANYENDESNCPVCRFGGVDIPTPPSSREGDWLPMDKAPRDGTVVKVLWFYEDKEHEDLAFWESGDWWQPDSGHGQAFHPKKFKYLKPAQLESSREAELKVIEAALDVINEMRVHGCWTGHQDLFRRSAVVFKDLKALSGKGEGG